MIIKLREVEFSLFELFLADGNLAVPQGISEIGLANWLTEALDSCIAKNGKAHGCEVLPPDDCDCGYLIALFSDRTLKYLPAKACDTVDELRKNLPNWLFECLDEINGLKLDWSHEII